MDPTKKELYTAKRPSGLDISSATVRSAIAALKADHDPCNWVLLKISTPAVVDVHASGESGVDGLLESLVDDDILYGCIRCTVTGRVKFFHLFFVGADVGGMKKGKASLYKSSVFSLVDAHGEITVSDGREAISKDTVLAAICKLSNCSTADIII